VPNPHRQAMFALTLTAFDRPQLRTPKLELMPLYRLAPDTAGRGRLSIESCRFFALTQHPGPEPEMPAPAKETAAGFKMDQCEGVRRRPDHIPQSSSQDFSA
jgi:hypothetical protein